MSLLETANNAFLAMVAAPEAIREARELLKERHEHELNAPRVDRLMRRIESLDRYNQELESQRSDRANAYSAELEKLRDRIADLEHNIEATEASNANLTELVERLETELATLRAKAELTISEPTKPEPRWVACTAAEAESNPHESEWLNVSEWTPFAEDWMLCVFDRDFAYRTTAQLDDWLPVSRDVFATICARDDSHMIEKTSNSIYGWKVRRSTIPLGTVLG